MVDAWQNSANPSYRRQGGEKYLKIEKYFSAQPSRRGSFYERQNSSSYGLENKQPWSVYKLKILKKIFLLTYE